MFSVDLCFARSAREFCGGGGAERGVAGGDDALWRVLGLEDTTCSSSSGDFCLQKDKQIYETTKTAQAASSAPTRRRRRFCLPHPGQ